MRRRLFAAALAFALLAGAGCSGSRGNAEARPSASVGTSVSPAPGGPASGDPVPGGAASGATPSGVATGNAADVCLEARKLSADQVSRFLAELGDALTASGDGDQAKADEARRAAAAAIRTWSAGLRAQAARADDARLAALLRDMAAEVGTMTADIDSIDEAKLDRLQQRLDQLCGG
jgi:hypothetical protein